MGYESSRYSVRDIALIRGIDLLVNAITKLQQDIIDLQTVYGKWNKAGYLQLTQQIQLIFKTSADDFTSKYLVHCLNQLNKEIFSEFPNREYRVKLSLDCLEAINGAVQSHSHIWNQAQLNTILGALSSGSITKTKPLPYYDEGENEKEEKEGKKEIKVVEFRSKK